MFVNVGNVKTGNEQMPGIETLSVQQVAQRNDDGGIELIDVRTPAEFGSVHASIARNVPLESFDPDAVMKSRNGSADAPLYLICQSGGRSMKACEKLVAAGHTNVVNVDGGTNAWEQSGLSVVRGTKKAVSLDRQVRIAAGSLVLLGLILSYAAHPYFVGLSAFVGAGLVFSGVTDTCAMGMLIAKMPWNQTEPC